MYYVQIEVYIAKISEKTHHLGPMVLRSPLSILKPFLMLLTETSKSKKKVDHFDPVRGLF